MTTEINITAKSFQNKNDKAFSVLMSLGFPLSRIRKSMILLNGVRLRELTAGGKVSITSASNTVKGRRFNDVAADAISQKLGLSVERLFPDAGGRENV